MSVGRALITRKKKSPLKQLTYKCFTKHTDEPTDRQEEKQMYYHHHCYSTYATSWNYHNAKQLFNTDHNFASGHLQ